MKDIEIQDQNLGLFRNNLYGVQYKILRQETREAQVTITPLIDTLLAKCLIPLDVTYETSTHTLPHRF